jgi:hypothetical protein
LTCCGICFTRPQSAADKFPPRADTDEALGRRGVRPTPHITARPAIRNSGL